MKPNFPIILIFNGVLDLIQSEDNLVEGSLLGFLRSNLKSIAYDNVGNLWEVNFHSERFKDNLISRLLANTIYNPKIQVTSSWKILKEYDLQELKNLIVNFIKEDEDIYTQFVKAKVLIKYVSDAKTFDEIYKILL